MNEVFVLIKNFLWLGNWGVGRAGLHFVNGTEILEEFGNERKKSLIFRSLTKENSRSLKQ